MVRKSTFCRIVNRLLVLIISICGINYANGQMVNIYAAPNGVDTGNGTSVLSAVSLSRAVIITKNFKNDSCTVWLSDGTYNQLILDSTNTRLATAPVVYQSINPPKAIFQPLTILNQANFQVIPDSIRRRIVDSVAKTKVMQMSLAGLSLKNMGVWPNSFGIANLTSPKFYNNGVQLPMSRYPKDSTMTMMKVLQNGTGGKMPGGTFVYRNDRCKYWLNELNDAGLYLVGAWRVPWQIDVVKTQDIDTVADTIQQVIGVSGGIGDKYTRPNGNGKEPYWAINLVEEISMPGEWSINFKTKMLYMWPLDSAVLQVASDATQSAINVNSVANTTFKYISIVGGAGDGFTITNCNSVNVAGCDISYCSGNGITITGGANCTVQSNQLHKLGGNGVKIASKNLSSDQKNVTLCNHRVINNDIYSVAIEKQIYYAPVDISLAVGAYIGNNRLHDAPHMGIYFGGNSCLMEYNDIYNVMTKYGGVSGIYRNSSYACRGNILHHNYVHDNPLGGGLSEDGESSGDSMSYNIMAMNKELGTNNAGGYATRYTNNICYNAQTAHSSIVTKDTMPNYIKNIKILAPIYNSSPAFRAAYPDAGDMLDTVNQRNKAFTSRQWNRLYGNVFVSNVQVFAYVSDKTMFNSDGTTNIAATTSTADPFKKWGTVVHDNFKINGKLLNPIFPFKIDSLRAIGAFDYTLEKDWHINRIGLYKDVYRTDLSVATQGINPALIWQKDSINGDSCTLTMKITNPNIENNISSIKYYLDGNEFMPLSILKKTISFDTVMFTAVFGGVAAGKHIVIVTIFDSTFWQYSSSADTFVISKGLPVEIVDFTGKIDGNVVCLNWNTANEVNIRAYELEKSTDRKHFVKIGSVEAKSNGGNKGYYGFTTSQPVTEDAYYRIKILENSNIASYSKVIELRSEFSNTYKLVIFPNPAKGQVNIGYNSNFTSNNAHILLINSLGKVVSDKVTSITQGDHTQIVSISGLIQGVYLVKLIDKDNTIAEGKVVITK